MQLNPGYDRQHDIDSESHMAYMALWVLVVLLTLSGVSAARFDIGFLIRGLGSIIRQPDILINDYIAGAGLGPAFLNAGLCAFAGLVILKRSRVRVSGPAIAAVFTIAGFALFGKNVANIWPSIIGVFLFSFLNNRPLSENIFVALFGTTLAPLSSELAFGLGIPAPWNFISALAAGAAAGFVLSPIARHVLDFHRGYNLYNIGFAAGFIGTMTLSVLKAFGIALSGGGSWGDVGAGAVVPYLAVSFLGMMVAGVRVDPLWYREYGHLLRSPGRLVSDFVRAHGLGATLFNMGVMGLLSVAFILVIGGDWNGPVIGGILTVVGFSAFGKHPLNALPPMIGVAIAAMISDYGLTAPASQLAVLFSATLAPVSGTYGPVAGLIAGMLHLVMVQTVGVLHGGLNLYNNGFAGGMTAGILVPILEWIREWRRHEV
ncbi:MAG: DUF1576 domain-containing protein [Spirochaetales bacterium]|nr:MAG: DUF1576 domain-containing protein [Spirochaetales bacterium]